MYGDTKNDCWWYGASHFKYLMYTRQTSASVYDQLVVKFGTSPPKSLNAECWSARDAGFWMLDNG